MFPCFDDLRHKTKFQITIKNNLNLTALSNMQSNGTFFEKRYQLNCTVFSPTHQLSLDQIAIVLTNFFAIYINKYITLYHRTSLTGSLKLTERLIENLTSYLKSKFYNIRVHVMNEIRVTFSHIAQCTL